MAKKEGETYQLPAQQNYAEATKDVLQAQIDLAPDLYRAEADPYTGRPAYARLDQNIVESSLVGNRGVRKAHWAEGDGSGSGAQSLAGPGGADAYWKEQAAWREKDTALQDRLDQNIARHKLFDGWGSKLRYERGDEWGPRPEGTAYGSSVDQNLADAQKAYDDHGGGRFTPSDEFTSKYGELSYDESGNPEFELEGATTGGSPGIVSLLAGEREKNFATGGVDAEGNMQTETRRSGFDAEGNFLGIDTLGKDLQADAARRSRSEDMLAMEELGGKATELYRDQGDIRARLNEATDLGKTSAIPGEVGSRGDALYQQSLGQGYDRVSSPLAAGGLGQQGQPGRVGGPNFEMAQAAAQGATKAGGMMGSLGGMGGAFVSTPVNTRTEAGQDHKFPVLKQKPPQVVQGGSSKTPQQIPQQGGGQGAAPGSKTPQQIPQQGGGLKTPQTPQQQGPQQQDWTGLRQGLVNQASSDLALGGDISRREHRALSQGARAASTARGRGRDFGGVVNEVAALEDGRRRRELERKAFSSQVSGQESGVMMGLTEMDQRAQMANQAARAAQDRTRLGAMEKDIDRGVAVSQLNKQLEMAGRAQDRGYATQLVGLEQATSADPFTAILGRQSGAGVMTGQNIYGAAQGGLDAGPGLYNPQSGLGYIADAYGNAANLEIGRMSANATADAGASQMWGSILGGGAQGFFGRKPKVG